MPVEALKKLPIKAQKLWESAFKSAKTSGLSDERAGMVAWSAVKTKYKKDAEGLWILKGGFVTSKEIILRTFEEDGDFYFEGYLTSWEPDNGNMTNSNNGESVRVSPEAGAQIANDLVEMGLGGGINHDTFEGSRDYNPDADQVFTVVTAKPDDYGLLGLMKLNKHSKRFFHAKEGILRGLYSGLSLEIFPAQAGFTYETTPEGKPYKNLLRVERTVGVTLAKNPLDNRARIKRTYQARKNDGRERNDGITTQESVTGANPSS